MFWLGLFLPICYVAGVTDLYILSGWIVLSLALPFLFLRPIKVGPAHYLGAAFLLYAFASLAWTPVWQQGIWDLWLLSMLAACFCLGERDDLRSLYKGLAIGIGVNTAIAIGQDFGWETFHRDNSDYPPGLFFNPDMLGEAATLTTVALYTTRQYWLLPLTLPAVFLTHSRSAMVALAIVVVWELWRRYRWKVILGLAIVAVPIIALDHHHSAKASLEERKAIWLDTIDGLTPFGHGAGSFFTLYPKYASRTDTMLTRPEDPHNDYLNLAFEFGIGAAPVFALLVLATFSNSSAWPILLAYLAISFVSFPIRIPIEGLLGMAALGQCCRDSTLARRLSDYCREARVRWPAIPRRPVLFLEPIHPHRARIRGGSGGQSSGGRSCA